MSRAPALAPAAPARKRAAPLPDPLVRHRADPHIHRHSDGSSCFTATATATDAAPVPEHDRIVLRRSRILDGLTTAAEPVTEKGRFTTAWAQHQPGPDQRVFLTCSARATDHHNGMGLLTADADADPVNPAARSKSPTPVLTGSDTTRQYREIAGEPLDDPHRHPRVQKLDRHADGTPKFGIPVADTATDTEVAS